ncbi:MULTISPECIES: peptide-methionine (S)-S-oxide reductase MsrA [Sediminibacillus]|uniref:peptide-methionine (S)-S-oxide reductase MsrA n=1 Tax=Sediminibacillus TaxID=482460 RepID=UPI0004023D86|nr:peptide-methionine (S)-S-oxide reductase MsrA [Sediminibacillus terrae]
MTKQTALATFAGGCFWCMVKPFDQFEGIHQVVSGYMGGHVTNPTYEQVKTGETGHYEVVQISFDPDIFPYQRLLDIYWPQVDPTDDGGQFHDRGSQYRAAIFYHDEKQKQLAEQSKQAIIDSGRFQQPVVTEILPASTFYRAETYHQDFYKKNKKYYQEDRAKSGRDEFIENHWS